MAYTQPNSPFKQVAAKAATRKKGGSSYDNFIDNTASYLKGEQGLIPDSITGGKPTRKAIGDGIRKVANSIDPKRKSLPPGPKPSKPSKPGPKPKKAIKPSKPGKPSKSAGASKNVTEAEVLKSISDYKANQEAKFGKALEESEKRDRNKKTLPDLKPYPNVKETPPVKKSKTKLRK